MDRIRNLCVWGEGVSMRMKDNTRGKSPGRLDQITTREMREDEDHKGNTSTYHCQDVGERRRRT